MSLNIAIQMDPPERLNYEKDSTFVLALEAQKRGYTLFYYNVDTISLHNGIVTASCAPVTFNRDNAPHYTLGNFENTDLTSFDIILMRQDNNDPVHYTAVTHLLDHVAKKTLVVNDPTGTRESPEKMLITHFPDLAPPTLITRNLKHIQVFQKQHAELIIKPLNGYGGMDIYHLKPDDDNVKAVHEMLSRLHSEPFVVQKYLPEIKDGDKRIILVEGEPIAGIARIPEKNNSRANLAQGGTAVPMTISKREREICERLKPELIKRKLPFIGLDVIGDYVTEINPKSPTGLQQITKFQGIKCEESLWDAFEARYDAFKAA